MRWAKKGYCTQNRRSTKLYKHEKNRKKKVGGRGRTSFNYGETDRNFSHNVK